AELALHRLDEGRGRALLAQVDIDDHGLAALAADRGRGFVQHDLIASGEQEIAALIRERQGDRAPDAAARSGHERDFLVQSKVHRVNSPLRQSLVPGLSAAKSGDDDASVVAAFRRLNAGYRALLASLFEVRRHFLLFEI